MLILQTSSIALGQQLNTVLTRWRRLIEIAGDPYRPELHYMRGPGPRWRAKHRSRAECGKL
jgi:hypothetical protein